MKVNESPAPRMCRVGQKMQALTCGRKFEIMTQQRVIVYEMQDGKEEVFVIDSVEMEQHKRAQAERELHSRDTQVVSHHFENREKSK